MLPRFRVLLAMVVLFAAASLAVSLAPGLRRPALAADTGTPPPCSENALRAALAALPPSGGSLVVECATNIVMTKPISVTEGISLTMSGDAQIASSGSRLFTVEPAAALTLRGLTLTGADVSGDGGAIYSAGQLTMDNVRMVDNSAARGGAVSIGEGAVLTVTASTFARNAASIEGGALYLAGSATLIDTTWSKNHAPNAGSIRVLAGAKATLDECQMRDGTSATAPALHNSGETDLSRCIITNMIAADIGTVKADYGAVDNDGLLRITNTVFLDNSSPDANSLHNHSVTPTNLSRMELTYVTIFGRATVGIAEVINNGEMTMRNTVINSATRYTCYQSKDVSDPVPTFESLGGNVLSDDNVDADFGCFATHTASTDHFDGAPLSVANDPTGMLLVFPTSVSPAINGALCIDGVKIDLRGVERGQNKGCDSGAVETRPGETFYRMYLPAVKRP